MNRWQTPARIHGSYHIQRQTPNRGSCKLPISYPISYSSCPINGFRFCIKKKCSLQYIFDSVVRNRIATTTHGINILLYYLVLIVLQIWNTIDVFGDLAFQPKLAQLWLKPIIILSTRFSCHISGLISRVFRSLFGPTRQGRWKNWWSQSSSYMILLLLLIIATEYDP